jgi:hypothetical protein
VEELVPKVFLMTDDEEFVKWCGENPGGLVFNCDHSDQVPYKAHVAGSPNGGISACLKPPFTNPYPKVCSTDWMALKQWAADQRGPLEEWAEAWSCGNCLEK